MKEMPLRRERIHIRWRKPIKHSLTSPGKKLENSATNFVALRKKTLPGQTLSQSGLFSCAPRYSSELSNFSSTALPAGRQVGAFLLRDAWTCDREIFSIHLYFDKSRANLVSCLHMSDERLRELERSGRFLFHGSGVAIEKFEPRQAHTIINGKQVPDGKPAIFASPFADYAVFMAIVNRANCPKGHRSGVAWENGLLSFTATRETLQQLDESSSGYVYVFNRSNFEKIRPNEWVSYDPVSAIEVLQVIWEDFKQTVSLIDNDIL